MVVANDGLWSADRLEAEGPAAKSLADLVRLVNNSGFANPPSKRLLERIADPIGDLSTEPSTPHAIPTPIGDAELNVLITILGYSQAPLLLESTSRNRHYIVNLLACLQRIGTRLQVEAQYPDRPAPLTRFLLKDVDAIRDMLFIYFETDCGRKWSMDQDMKVSLRAAVLRVLNRFNTTIQTMKDNSLSELLKENGTSPSSICHDTIAAALADFVTFQEPFSDGLSMGARLKLVYRSAISDAILQYLPKEAAVSLLCQPQTLRPNDAFTLDPLDKHGSFSSALRVMTHASSCAWVCTPSSKFPESMQRFTVKQQKAHYRKVRRLSKKANDISTVLSAKKTAQASEDHHEHHSPRPNMMEGIQSSWAGRMRVRFAARAFTKRRNSEARKQMKLKHINRQIAAVGLGLESETWVEELGIAGMFREMRNFSERVAKEQPEISNTDGERQAVRNLWACFGLEGILFQQKPHSNDAIFAYSMIYPKTDNFLDSVEVTKDDKIAFQKAFHKRIRGDSIPEISGNEPLKNVLTDVSDLVAMIEGRWARERHPFLYLAALAVNSAQTVSLLTQRAKLDNRQTVMQTTLYKGGISVLADAFLVQGKLTLREAGFSFVLGCCLQMMDDLQDVAEDMSSNIETLFTPTNKNSASEIQSADANGRRLFWFLSQVWLSQDQMGKSDRRDSKLQKRTSSQRNDVVIKTTLRISQMMALKALFRGRSIFSEKMLRDASTRCSVEPQALLQLHGITFLHKMAKMDYI